MLAIAKYDVTISDTKGFRFWGSLSAPRSLLEAEKDRPHFPKPLRSAPPDFLPKKAAGVHRSFSRINSTTNHPTMSRVCLVSQDDADDGDEPVVEAPAESTAGTDDVDRTPMVEIHATEGEQPASVESAAALEAADEPLEAAESAEVVAPAEDDAVAEASTIVSTIIFSSQVVL